MMHAQNAKPSAASFLGCLPWLWSHVLFPGRSPQPGRIRWFGLALFLILPAAVLYPCLSFHLFEPDEGRYAQIPFEMLARGEWLVPYLQGEPYLDKPPLFYWLVMFSYSIFGVHDWSARLVPAVAVHGCILLVYLFGCRRMGERWAFWGALALALMPGFLSMARLLVLDGLLTFLVTLALFSLWEALNAGRAGLRERPAEKQTRGADATPLAGSGWWLIAAVACGLGILCKGPVILLLTIPPVWLHCVLTKNGRRPSRRQLLAFGAVMLAIALPWYVAICVRVPHFAQHFLWQHNILRFIQPFDHLQPVWYYVPILSSCLLPAGLLLFPMVRSLLIGGPETAHRRPPELGFLLLAGGWCVLFFSLSGSKLPTYILPAFPPLALALGMFLAASGWEKSVWTKGAAVAAFSLLVAGNYFLVPRFAESRSPLCDAESVLVLCRDPAVPVICHPRLLNSVAFALGRDDLRGFRGKEMQEMIDVLRCQPRTVVWFSQISCQKSLQQLLPPDLEMTQTARLGLCSMAVIEKKQYTNRGTTRLFEGAANETGHHGQQHCASGLGQGAGLLPAARIEGD